MEQHYPTSFYPLPSLVACTFSGIKIGHGSECWRCYLQVFIPIVGMFSSTYLFYICLQIEIDLSNFQDPYILIVCNIIYMQCCHDF
jgi:hypothetical protein